MRNSTSLVVLGRKLWTPANILTALWLDAADLSTITLNSSTVSQWRDKSGNDRHATTVNGSPNIISASQNSLSTINFFDTRMTFSRLTSLGHILFVAKKADVFRRSFLGRDGAANDLRGINFGSEDSSNFVVQQLAPINSGAIRNNWHIVEIATDGSNATLGINATRVSAADTDRMSISELGWYHVIDYTFTGEIAEVIVSRSVLSNTDRQRLEGYLAHKWGLTANLPNNHPFRFTPPTA